MVKAKTFQDAIKMFHHKMIQNKNTKVYVEMSKK